MNRSTASNTIQNRHRTIAKMKTNKDGYSKSLLINKSSLSRQYRQGDVLLVETSKSVDWKKENTKGAEIILAQKPQHEHSHRISTEHTNLYKCENRVFIETSLGATLVHEEHQSLKLIPGCYEVIIQRQFLAKNNVSGSPSAEWHYFNSETSKSHNSTDSTSSSTSYKSEEERWYEYMD